MSKLSFLAAYVRQQKELAMPDFILGRSFDAGRYLRAFFPAPPPQERTAATGGPRRGPVRSQAGAKPSALKIASAGPLSRLKKLTLVRASPASPPGQLTYEQKRARLKELYTARCGACRLASTRKNFVFGSGNAGAALMIVGEAPGAEEDERGLPLVGEAGRLLDELLAAIGLDRKKDVFITDILKCKPPEKADPAGAEARACLALLDKQIAIIAPKILLLLGSVPAQALLGAAGGMAESRGSWRSYRGIPALVTYHPSAIRENAEYRPFADEDFQRVSQRLKESG